MHWRFGAAALTAFLVFVAILFTPYNQNRYTLPRWKAKTTGPIDASKAGAEAPWLLATMSPAGGIGRRIVIRETWQRLYGNDSRFDMRFVIANASHPWEPYVKAENDTHGDIIMLSHLPESRSVANSIKPMEFLKALVAGTMRPYKFVSKIDDDSFLDATTFYDKYLDPLLQSATNNKMQVSPTMIGKHARSGYVWPYPAGAFYTLTWDLVKAAVVEYARNSTQGIKDEDALIGKLLFDSGLQFDFQALPYREAFDFVAPEGNAWAQKNESLDQYWHALGPGAINVHNLKNDPTYLQVSSCFNESGVNMDIWRDNVDLKKWGKTGNDVAMEEADDELKKDESEKEKPVEDQAAKEESSGEELQDESTKDNDSKG